MSSIEHYDKDTIYVYWTGGVSFDVLTIEQDTGGAFYVSRSSYLESEEEGDDAICHAEMEYEERFQTHAEAVAFADDSALDGPL